MKVTLKSSIKGQLSFNDIKPNGVYICTSSPSGNYDNWVLIGTAYMDLIGIWAGEGSAVYNESTYFYKEFKFKEINAELVEI